MGTRTCRRARTDYPKGVLAIYDNGGRTMDRYTVVYMPTEIEGEQWFQYVGMSENPFHPQGFGQHGEAKWYNRPRSGWGTSERNVVIPFESLPPDCQRLVKQDLEEDND